MHNEKKSQLIVVGRKYKHLLTAFPEQYIPMTRLMQLVWSSNVWTMDINEGVKFSLYTFFVTIYELHFSSHPCSSLLGGVKNMRIVMLYAGTFCMLSVVIW